MQHVSQENTGIRIGSRLLAIVLVAFAVSALALHVGALPIAPSHVFDALRAKLLDTPPRAATPIEVTVVWDIRLPRVVLSAVVGAALSFAGTAYQGVFRNPLVDPYLLGSAAGAGLGATIAIAYLHAPILIAPLAFVGAIGAVGIAWSLGVSMGGQQHVAFILLAGIAVMSFLTALQTFLLQQKTESLQQVYTWILGQLSTSNWSDVLRPIPYVLVSAITLMLCARSLDVMSLGDDKSASLGVAVTRTRIFAVGAATLATAAAVAACGLIGFVGLVIPHIARRIVGVHHRILLPASACIGAAFLTLADMFARTVLAPTELPIGVVTAFVGAPFFALILRSTRKQFV